MGCHGESWESALSWDRCSHVFFGQIFMGNPPWGTVHGKDIPHGSGRMGCLMSHGEWTHGSNNLRGKRTHRNDVPMGRADPFSAVASYGTHGCCIHGDSNPMTALGTELSRRGPLFTRPEGQLSARRGWDRQHATQASAEDERLPILPALRTPL